MQHFNKLQRAQKTQRQQESRLALRNLFRATHDWGLDRRDALALAGISSLHQLGHWSSSGDDILLTDDQMEVISYLLTLHLALATDRHRPAEMEAWLNNKESQCDVTDGKSPLKYLQNHPYKLIAAKTLCQSVCQK